MWWFGASPQGRLEGPTFISRTTPTPGGLTYLLIKTSVRRSWRTPRRSVRLSDGDVMPDSATQARAPKIMRFPQPHDRDGRPWRVARPHCCGRAPSEPCVRVIPAHGSSKPRGLAGGRKCWAVAMVGVGPTYAVRMEEAGCDGVARCSWA